MFFSREAIGRIPYEFKNEFESATVNEPSVFESLKIYCTSTSITVFGDFSLWEHRRWEMSGNCKQK